MTSVQVAGFVMKPQQPYANLCWAAVALRVDLWHNPGHWATLCQVSGETASPLPINCCPDDRSDACDRTGSVVMALQFHGLLAGFPKGVSHPMSMESMDSKWDFIKTEIGKQRVVCASIGWKPVPRNGGHEVVISGYSEDQNGGSRTVDILDPFFAASPGLSYSQFMSDYQDGGECVQLSRVI